MERTLRILNLEDDPKDTELIQAKLEEEGIACELVRVETEADFVSAVEQGGYDLLLVDYKLPGFDGMSALAISKEKCSDIPFVFVSGSIGEDVAIEALKNGATDYVLKDKLSRLAPAIRRALQDAALRRERKQAEEVRKKLEAQLRHAQKMEAVGTLAGGIAHDFNNILNVIIGYGTMVMDRIGDDQLSKEQMNEVLTAADKAVILTKRLLVFSRKQIVEVKPVNVNETILSIQKMLVRIIRESIDFKLDLTDRTLVVMADAGQIEQVLMNLTTNAMDAMPEGGCLTIGTGLQELDDEYVAAHGYGKPGMYALITVADTGYGMDAETQKKIFEPFFTTKGIGEGTGLGLAVSYGIIKQHGGYINVYSESGQGTVFRIYLQLIEESAFSVKEIEPTVPVKGGTETILVAEDDASLRKLTRIVLESYGYNVITAEDGEDAITKYTENRGRIDLVILDMIMPKKSGKEACEEIKKLSPGTKILFLSGYTMDIIKTRELTEAGFDFILKPVVPRDLVRKVREILDK